MKFRLTAIAAVATLALLGTACGSDDSSDSGSGSSDRSAQNDTVTAKFMDSGEVTMDEACIRAKVESLSDEDIAIVAVEGDEELSDAGQQTVASRLECAVAS